MTLVLADRVQESTTTTGTGNVTLGGASQQSQSFLSGIGNGNYTYYALLDGNGVQWEVGQGNVISSGAILSRDIIYASTNSNSKIPLSSNVHTVFGNAPAHLLALIGTSGAGGTGPTGAAGSGGGSSSVLGTPQYVRIVIPQANINTMHTAPILAIPAPGAGNLISIIRATYHTAITVSGSTAETNTGLYTAPPGSYAPVTYGQLDVAADGGSAGTAPFDSLIIQSGNITIFGSPVVAVAYGYFGGGDGVYINQDVMVWSPSHNASGVTGTGIVLINYTIDKLY
jgi:hypothetical protein